MQELRANTEVKVRIGSFMDAADGVTPETGVTLGAADQAEILKHGSDTVVDISAATWAAVTNCGGWYVLTLTVSLVDTEGQLDVIIQDTDVCLPVVRSFMVLSEAAWDSKYSAKDDGFMDVNIKTIGRADTQETEANNLESACANYSATRGLTGTAVPAAAADGVGGLPISDAGGLDLDAILVDTNELQTNQGNWVTAVGFSTHSAADVWAVATRVLTANTNLNDPTAAAIADAVWDETIADHAGVGSTGAALAAAGGSGDPWSTAVPGAYGAGTAGYILGTNLDATISSRGTADPGDAMTLANGAITDASLAGNMEIVFETDFSTNYNATRNAWVTNAQDFVGTTASDPFNATIVAASLANLTIQAGTTFVSGSHNPQTGDAYAVVSDVTHGNSAISTDIGLVKNDTETVISSTGVIQSDVSTLLNRVTNTLFSGITSLAEWLGLIAGKQSGDSTARTELRATGGGSGTFDETTDSVEAIRDNLTTCVTATGFATPTNVTDARDAVTAALADGTVQVGTVRNGAIGADAVADIFSTTAIVESYAADGAEGTPAQLLYLIQQALTEFAIVTDTITAKKLDGSTTAATFTLDDATTPTSRTRAT